MKIISWNVNGVRSILNKGFISFFEETKADIYCLQETKIHNEDVLKNTEKLNEILTEKGYKSYWHGAQKKGYSGVAIITKISPIKVIEGIGIKKFDDEGRVLALEFNKFILINLYVPNSKRELERLNERIEFNRVFIDFCENLRKKTKKGIIFCGDLNVAHKEIDLTNPKSNLRNAGFTIEERNEFDFQLSKGYSDTFRMFNNEPNNYTWWSYMRNARAKNIGWRIDYFIVSNDFKNNIKSSVILPKIMGSDHCPILLEIK
jgi:exodeoxyribonuclease III